MTSIYVEEKRLLRGTHSWLCRRLMNCSASDQQGNRHGSNQEQPQRLLDEEFGLFRCQPGAEHDTSSLAATHMKTYHLLSILRRVPSKSLYMFFGWKTTPRGTDAARKELARWVTENQQSAREALQHSAILFRIIRNQNTTNFFDPFWLLISVLYMRIYVQLEDISLKETSTTFQPPSRTGKPLRIDQLLDDDISKSWTILGPSVPLHITGVGFLDGAESGPRILKESLRILNRKTGWNGVSSAVSQTIGQVLNGMTPNLTR
ncbi:hypothetical protein MRS44_013347 [Fusarium solani]|uniref:uncharacterized protein n=1 Tax=Fusarium solani TaxID=169388 RepID=UPI0032C46F32|nr:hypothetical protein MRS44_013347 [Fusarium solani]